MRGQRRVAKQGIGAWLSVCCICSAAAYGQNASSAKGDAVRIQVDAQASRGAFKPVWSFFGYDEPNYTYAEHGKKLLGELRVLSGAPVYVRVHNLLTSGDGTAALKWGSTNAYTEDATGKPVYDWKIVDRIFDTFREEGIAPLVEVGFMPEALSTQPRPYKHDFPNGNIFTGWAYPPKDYEKWEELAYELAKHLQGRYGEREVNNWLWEVWNEPDIDYWKGTREEFFKLYDFAAKGILRAVPDARIGGPDTTGAAGKNAADFLRAFLEHCSREMNAATGKQGAPLNFISFHPKGSPVWKGDHVQMRLERELLSVEKGFEVIAEFPEWRGMPVILGEWDPEGCAACSAKNHPENAYRNGNLYAVYTAEALKDTLTLAESAGINLAGVVTWSFEFEGQPYFEGYRELATNGIDKPVLNAFRMFGKLGAERVKLTSSAGASEVAVLKAGEAKIEGVDGIATRAERAVEVLVWNYSEEDIAGQSKDARVEIVGLPEGLKQARLEEFRVDGERSNAYVAWQKMGSPQDPDKVQYAALEKAGQLARTREAEWVKVEKEKYEVTLSLSQQSMVLLKLSW